MNTAMMNQTLSTKLLYASEASPIVQALVEQDASILSLEVPSFDEMMKSNPVPYYYRHSFQEARDYPVVQLHSSGSTGN
jgi:hypothetical protein